MKNVTISFPFFFLPRWVSVLSGIVCVIAFLPGIFVEFQSAEDGETDVAKENAEALENAQGEKGNKGDNGLGEINGNKHLC